MNKQELIEKLNIETDHTRFLERLLEALLGNEWQHLTLYKAKDIGRYLQLPDFPPGSILVVGNDGPVKVGEIPEPTHIDGYTICSVSCPLLLWGNIYRCKLDLSLPDRTVIFPDASSAHYCIPGPNCPKGKEK